MLNAQRRSDRLANACANTDPDPRNRKYLQMFPQPRPEFKAHTVAIERLPHYPSRSPYCRFG
jgi:hypothetical protein